LSLELLRFKDLRRLGVVSSWPQLRRMQESYGFPVGILLGPNSRAWRAVDVEAWLATRPTDPSEHVMKRTEKAMAAKAAAQVA